MNKKLADMETVFKALADATRLRVLGLLLTGEVCVCHIHDSLKIPQPKASRHLAYLRKAGLVETRRDGLWVHYRMAELSDPVLETIHRTVTHALRHLDVVRKDVERLHKLTGCCLPADEGTPSFACCGGERQAPASTGAPAIRIEPADHR
jgi:ArsR family transcriptional regulator, arsenate/arsenite/antimonite-responsive transcriptional repressor